MRYRSTNTIITREAHSKIMPIFLVAISPIISSGISLIAPSKAHHSKTPSVRFPRSWERPNFSTESFPSKALLNERFQRTAAHLRPLQISGHVHHFGQRRRRLCAELPAATLAELVDDTQI